MDQPDLEGPAKFNEFAVLKRIEVALVVTGTGLHEGLRSLIAGGAPPGFLIIDDGWQCTDVDEPLRQPPMVKPAPRSLSAQCQ